MKRYGVNFLICITIVLFIITGCSNENTVNNIQDLGSGKYSCDYDGVKHEYILDLPKIMEGATLILMLHGYGGSAETFRTDTGMSAVAVENGYGVLYVTGAKNSNDKTSATGWNSGIGISENKDVEFLLALIEYVVDEYGFDSEHTYVSGYSNGAFMVHRLAIETDNVFKGFVSVAGMMPESIWKNKPEKCEVNFMQITGEKDDVIPKLSDGSAKYSKAPAIEDVLTYFGSDKVTDTVPVGKKSELTKYKNDTFGNVVWHIFVRDGRHSWPDEGVTGININEMILDFFDSLG